MASKLASSPFLAKQEMHSLFVQHIRASTGPCGDVQAAALFAREGSQARSSLARNGQLACPSPDGPVKRVPARETRARERGARA